MKEKNSTLHGHVAHDFQTPYVTIWWCPQVDSGAVIRDVTGRLERPDPFVGVS